MRALAGRAWAALRALARRPLDALAVVLVVAVIVLWGVVTAWGVRHALAVNRLASGVGDVVFYGGDGRPWFRLDERRRDVPLDADRAGAAAGGAGDRRPALLLASRHRSAGARARCARRTARRGQMREGASTLTQQLARTLFLSNRRTLGRKVQEAALAVMLEMRLHEGADPRAVSESRVSQRRAVRRRGDVGGASSASTRSDLTLAEAALIAGLVQAPSALSPWSNLDGARRAQ